MTEDAAGALIRRAATRQRLLILLVLVLLAVVYTVAQLVLFDRSLGPAALNSAGLFLLLALLQYFVMTPPWVRRPGATPIRTQVTRVGENGHGQQVLQLRSATGAVRVDLPRGASGVRKGETLWASEEPVAGRAVALVLPDHATGGRRVVSVQPDPA